VAVPGFGYKATTGWAYRESPGGRFSGPRGNLITYLGAKVGS